MKNSVVKLQEREKYYLINLDVKYLIQAYHIYVHA
jgi:hypothetical protein